MSYILDGYIIGRALRGNRLLNLIGIVMVLAISLYAAGRISQYLKDKETEQKIRAAINCLERCKGKDITIPSSKKRDLLKLVKETRETDAGGMIHSFTTDNVAFVGHDLKDRDYELLYLGVKETNIDHYEKLLKFKPLFKHSFKNPSNFFIGAEFSDEFLYIRASNFSNYFHECCSCE